MPPKTPDKPTAAEPPELQVAPFRPVSGRQRWLIAGLTLATVLVIAVLMLRPSRELANAKAARAEAARLAACPPGAASAAAGCPGGAMPVMMLPAAASR